MSRIFVTGATGFLGRSLVPDLVERGYQVTVLLRADSGACAFKRLPIHRAAGDVLDPTSLRAGQEGCDCVVHAAGLVSYRGAYEGLLQAVHVQGTQNVCRQALEFYRARGVIAP